MCYVVFISTKRFFSFHLPFSSYWLSRRWWCIPFFYTVFFLFSFQFISFHRQHTISHFYFFYFLLHFKTDFYRSVLDVWLQVCRFVCVHPAACRHGSSVEMILGMAAAPYGVSIECELTKPDCDCAVIHLLLNFVQKPFFFFFVSRMKY